MTASGSFRFPARNFIKKEIPAKLLFSEFRKIFKNIPPGHKTSWRRCNDVFLYAPVTSQVRLKWNT